MSLYLGTRGRTPIAVAICDRCQMKRPYNTLVNDVNAPGLRVCEVGCADLKDPYRLPARKTENISLRFPRPDQSIATTNTTTTDLTGDAPD